MHLSCSKHSSGFPKKLIFILLTMAQASQVALMVKNPPANAGDSGDRDNLVEKEESPKEERVFKPVISLSGKTGY